MPLKISLHILQLSYQVIEKLSVVLFWTHFYNIRSQTFLNMHSIMNSEYLLLIFGIPNWWQGPLIIITNECMLDTNRKHTI